MNTMINYVIEANLGLVLFATSYWLFLRNENQFTFNRFFLLGSILFSLLFPLGHFNSAFSTKVIPSISQVMPTYWLPEVGIRTDLPGVLPHSETTLSVWNALEWTYLIVALVFTLFFLIRLIQLGNLFVASKKYRWNDCFVVESESDQPTFSFFHFIFIGRAYLLTAKEKEEVLLHESVHVRKIHSFDIILINLLGIAFWYNPALLIYKKAFVQLHEFEADARSVENQDADSYCRLLAKVALESAGLSLVNHFNHSLTLKRITMMKTVKKKIQSWKLILVGAAVPLFFLAVSCQEQVTGDLYAGKNPAGVIPTEVRQQLEMLKQKNPQHEYIVIQLNDEGKKTLDKLQFENAKMGTIISTNAIVTDKGSNGEKLVYVIVEKGTGSERADATRFDKAYTVVDDQPEYVGGFDSLLTHIQRTLRYPENARKKGIEGRVFVSFVVTKEGDVVVPAIAKGVDPEIDKAALEVVSGFPRWIPGRQKGEAVDVKFVIPINFKINN